MIIYACYFLLGFAIGLIVGDKFGKHTASVNDITVSKKE